MIRNVDESNEMMKKVFDIAFNPKEITEQDKTIIEDFIIRAHERDKKATFENIQKANEAIKTTDIKRQRICRS